MHYRTCPRVLAAVAAIAAGVAGQDSTGAAPADDVMRTIARAEKLVQKGPSEDAVLLLWQAEAELLAMPAGAARDAGLGAVHALSAKADALDASRREAFAAVAKKLVEVAQPYRQKRWYDAAEERLSVAARFDEAAAQKELQAMAAARSKDSPAAKAGAKPAAAPVPKVVKALIPAMVADNKNGSWRIDGEQLVGPGDSEVAGNYWYLTNTTNADHEISVEIKISEKKGIATLVFGGVTPTDQFGAVFERRDLDDWALRCECDSGTGVENLKVVDGSIPPAVDGWHRLTVRVRGKAVQVELDGGALQIEATTARPAHGKVGFMVYGFAEKQPIRFRNLVIGPLPRRNAEGGDKAAAAQSELRAGLLAAIDRGEKLLAEKKPEAAMLALRQALIEARQLDAGALRDNLEATIDKLLTQADGNYGRRKKAAVEIGAVLAQLAARYTAAPALRCARVVLRDAAAFDAAGQAAAIQKVDEAIAAAEAAQALARQHELDPPVVDGTQQFAWLQRGKSLFRGATPWAVTAAGAHAGLTGGDFVALLPEAKLPPGGRFALHLHLDAPGTAGGFVFDAHGDNDFGCCVLERLGDKLVFGVFRYTLGKWQRLERGEVLAPPWRHAGWFELQLEDDANGVRARVADLELKVERSRIGAQGPVGICAQNSSETSAGVEVRGLHALAPPK